jgi:hypothetical protein
MALIKKIGGKSAIASSPKRPTMQLPTKASVPPTRFSDYSMLIYGRKKIGKTTLCAQLPNPYFISTEPGTKALRVRSSNVTSYQDISALMDQLEAKFAGGEKYCDTLVIDTVDLVYDLAWNKVCKDKMINHPSEEKDFGATWKEIRDLFRSVVTRALRLGCGVVFLSHDTEKEVELPDGEKIERRMPTMAARALNEIEGIVDVIGFYDYADGLRYLRIKGSDTLVAGCRCVENFRTPDGERVEEIPMGDDEKQSAKNLQLAFDNRQTMIGVKPKETPAAKRLILAKKK